MPKKGGLAVGLVPPVSARGLSPRQCKALCVQPHGEALQDQHRSSFAFLGFFVPCQPI